MCNSQHCLYLHVGVDISKIYLSLFIADTNVCSFKLTSYTLAKWNTLNVFVIIVENHRAYFDQSIHFCVMSILCHVLVIAYANKKFQLTPRVNRQSYISLICQLSGCISISLTLAIPLHFSWGNKMGYQ